MHAEVQTVACDTCFKTGFQFWIDFLKTVSFISMSFLKNFMVTWFMWKRFSRLNLSATGLSRLALSSMMSNFTSSMLTSSSFSSINDHNMHRGPSEAENRSSCARGNARGNDCQASGATGRCSRHRSAGGGILTTENDNTKF